MNNKTIKAAFIGTGGIARSHAFAINSLQYYYNDAPGVITEIAVSSTEKSRKSFAEKYGFRRHCCLEELLNDTEINSVFILGPNKVHVPHLQGVLKMKNIQRVYIEKPVCASTVEESVIKDIIERYPRIRFQVGFQYLFMPPVRSALSLWRTGIFGRPLHYEVRYYHGDYLKREYREKRQNRLTPAPEGGAMADLGSHALSLAVAFFGKDLKIISGSKAGGFADVDPGSDLFSTVILTDNVTGALGTLAASRISSGTGDMLEMQIYAEKGALKFSAHYPDNFEYYLEETGKWTRVPTGSNMEPYSSFPSGHVPPGWLRPMIHAHYLFLTDKNDEPMPDLSHGLAVQRLVRESSEFFNGHNIN